ncbi:hypothetical protein [Salipiger thiooxidans]|nr:hypothetical protein [Salipiger thiooxidans]MCA0846251.1 hypothetical protein [Salipiger thiooxidans]
MVVFPEPPPALPSVETYGDPVRTRRVIASSHANHPDIVGAFLMGPEAL